MSKRKKQTGRYVVEINDWGCGTMIKDTLTGKEIDAPAEETVNLCLLEMNRLAAEVESVRQVAQDNKTETGATRIENARLKAELERLKNTDPNSISGSTIMSDPDWSIACFRFHRENERAEIARLRRAGDNLERVLTTKVASYEVANASHEWLAAKEGKPSANPALGLYD